MATTTQLNGWNIAVGRQVLPVSKEPSSNGEHEFEEHFQFVFTEVGTNNQILFVFTGEVKDFIIQRLTGGVVLP